MNQLLPHEFIRDVEFDEVAVIKINTKKIEELLNDLKVNEKLFSPESLLHLKRITKTLEGELAENDEVFALICYKNDLEAIPENILTKYEIKNKHIIKKIPKHPPYTKEQYEKWKIYWPIKFKKDPLEIFNFSSSQKEKISKLMRMVIDISAETFLKGNRFNACMLYDSSSEKILLTSCDETNNLMHNIRHCVMNMMAEYSKKSIISKNDGEEKKDAIDKDGKRKNSKNLENYFDEKNYYCKDLDLFIVMEPCIMCSMALVHSRVKRVFYSIRHDEKFLGGLNPEIMLNNCDSLNHKFTVFEKVEEEYCLEKMKIKDTN